MTSYLKTAEEELSDVIELLRNGAIVAGNDNFTNSYRTRCLEQAYFHDIVPFLLESKLLDPSLKLENLIDLNAMYQKQRYVQIYQHVPGEQRSTVNQKSDTHWVPRNAIPIRR